MSIFKTCDIRGVYGKELDEDTAYRLGRAVGSRLMEQEVVIAGDLRPSTPALKQSLTQGLQESGAHVIDLGQAPTPALYYAKGVMDVPGSVMVTASHNPPGYNGFKVQLGALPITEEELQALARQMQEARWTTGQGTHREAEIAPAYISARCSGFYGLDEHFIVVDAGNGSMSTVAPEALRCVGQRVDPLYCEPDGTYPNRSPNPAVRANLGDLRDRVLAVGAELGVAYDGDGDRVIFVDESGTIHPADRVLVLFVRHLLAGHPGRAVVYDIKSSSVVAEEIKAAGGEPLIERSGHAFIKRRLLTEDAILGGEISGHYFFSEVHGDDALYATLLLLQILDALGTSLGAAMDTVPSYPITPEYRLPCPADEAQEILQTLEEAFAERPISHLDGVRIAFPDGWALARTSVTEPLITLRFEAHTEERLEAIQQAVRKASPRLDELMQAAPPPAGEVDEEA
jgi:phosphomannomutase/phosphoglucomutase